MTNLDDLTEAVEAAEAAGEIDIMVNNAGVWQSEDFFEVNEADYERMMDINLKGAYFGSQIAARRLAEGDGGSIITISSIAGLFGNGNWPTYSATNPNRSRTNSANTTSGSTQFIPAGSRR